MEQMLADQCEERRVCISCGIEKSVAEFSTKNTKGEKRRWDRRCKLCKATFTRRCRADAKEPYAVATAAQPNARNSSQEEIPAATRNKRFVVGGRTFEFTPEEFQQVVDVFLKLARWRDDLNRQNENRPVSKT